MEFSFSNFCFEESDKVLVGGIFSTDFDASLGEICNSSIVGNSDKIKLGGVFEVACEDLYGNAFIKDCAYRYNFA